ncbi:hypothetical protein SAMN06265365_115115 [Tistlia consotensis]|uniref:Uncharacterized protein n=1 Tax=Tistlia consotensis USBA 355 TaxID=560819 RepID=A0A1Y6C4P7_9PROT|nr:hypothetical protein SAMN05428998_11618 [Tistlia consotensis USBA 355]SNR79677.1 hypothetical protein SAMN06265365_115115 [Tistlia consotensis]
MLLEKYVPNPIEIFSELHGQCSRLGKTSVNESWIVILVLTTRIKRLFYLHVFL